MIHYAVKIEQKSEQKFHIRLNLTDFFCLS